MCSLSAKSSRGAFGWYKEDWDGANGDSEIVEGLRCWSVEDDAEPSRSDRFCRSALGEKMNNEIYLHL